MTSLLIKVALAGALTLASVLGLVGISGLIIFADVKPPEASAPMAAVVQSQTPASPSGALNFAGPNK